MTVRTGNGDKGLTQVRGEMFGKDSTLVEALGALDEAMVALGMAEASVREQREKLGPIDLCWLDKIIMILPRMQDELHAIMADLSGYRYYGQSSFVRWMDRFARETDPLTREFVRPGHDMQNALMHNARAAVRRAERCVVRLSMDVYAERAGVEVSKAVLQTLNIMSDVLFLLAQNRLPDKLDF